jgi:predicted ABC-class ATPase
MHQVEILLPSGRVARGMGIPTGVTVICGGGFHGKSTLLKALERGVYNHMPGDGRELVVCDDRAVKIRAEDGRSVGCVDISTFIDNLPYGKQTTEFSTPDASGSTSQATNIEEALEAGSTCLLLDEDTCATNFMIRDARMQLLVSSDKEPIKPFISRVRSLVAAGVSSVMVVGGCGEYFDVADRVISMDEFKPIDATAEAKAISDQFMTEAQRRILDENMRFVYPMKPSRSVQYVLPRDIGKVTVRNKSLVQFGDVDLDLSCVEQIVDASQTRAIADTLQYIHNSLLSGGRDIMTVAQVLNEVETLFQSGHGGMDVLSSD